MTYTYVNLYRTYYEVKKSFIDSRMAAYIKKEPRIEALQFLG